MSKISRKPRDKPFKATGDHQKYISRITKTLYYGRLPRTDRLSLPVTELAAEIFSESQRGRSLDRLHCNDAAEISSNACVSPCSLVLAVLYLERLKTLNPEYLEKTAPSDLFLVSLMVSCKFLYDDGEKDEVFIDEWATSAGISVKHLVQLERDFLSAIEWEIYVNELTFWKKLTEIETTIAKQQGISRGFFTYSELQNLLTTIEIQNIVQCVVAITTILVASYAAAFLTLVGSVLIVSQIPGTSIQPQKIDNQQNHTLLPVMQSAEDNLHISEQEILANINELKTDHVSKNDVKVVNVLKTGIFLVSIEGLLKPFCSKTNQTDGESDSDVQHVSWNWWTVPSMNWLCRVSQLTENLNLPTFDLGYWRYFLETYVSNVKHLELEDNIRKATKTRIQDQMENSWHVEWIDTTNDHQFYYYVQNVKT